MTRRDPSNPASFNHRIAHLSTGRMYHFVDEFNRETFDPVETPTLLCIHGFPDFWYGWRYQIAPWYNAGWRVLVPDMLGYGQTDKPDKPSAYTTKSLSDDLAALLDFIEVPRVVVLGHDWGSAIAWRFAAWHPDRCQAMINFSIPYNPPQRIYMSLEEIVKTFPDFGYQLYFADGRYTYEIEQNLGIFLALLYQTPTSGVRDSTVTLTGRIHSMLLDKSVKWDKPWNGNMSENDIQYYLETFSRGGMTGPLNYYRTTRLRYEEETQKIAAQLPRIPWMLVYGDKDRTCNHKLVQATRKFAPQIKVVKLEGRSHWVMIEAEREVTELVLDFVKINCINNRARL